MKILFSSLKWVPVRCIFWHSVTWYFIDGISCIVLHCIACMHLILQVLDLIGTQRSTTALLAKTPQNNNIIVQVNVHMATRPGLLEAWLTLTSVKYHGNLFSGFTWRHGRHVGVPKQRNGGHVGVPTQSSGNWTLLLCKRSLVFSLKNMAVDHVSETQE